MNVTRNSPSRPAAALPAASTSWWSSFSPVMPAAALVTMDRPNTSMPAARAAGVEVMGLSMVTNAAAGITGEKLDHEEVLAAGKAAAGRLGEFLVRFVGRLP